MLPLQHSGKSASTIDVEAILVGDGVLKLEVSVDMWRLSFAIDVEPPTGALRGIASTVAAVAGVDHRHVLSAVVTAISRPALPLESAA